MNTLNKFLFGGVLAAWLQLGSSWAALAAPSGLSPGTSTDTGLTVADLRPTMSWNAVSTAGSYHVYASKEPYGSANLVINGANTTTTSFTPSAGALVANTKYRWQVAAVSSAGVEGTVSSIVYFKTPGEVLPAPGGTTPGTTTDTGFTVADLRPALSWNSVNGAAGYHVYASKEPYGAANLVINGGNASGTSYTPAVGAFAYNTKYRWQVVAVGSNGAEGNLSQVLYFKTPPDVVVDQNPTVSQIVAKIKTASHDLKIPAIVIAAIISKEGTGWKQFDDSGNAIVGSSGDIGLMQINITSPAYGFDIARVKNEWEYNFDVGCQILLGKYALTPGDTISPYDGSIDADPSIVETWWLAVARYNGGGTQAFDYVKLAWSYVESLPLPANGQINSIPLVGTPTDLPGFPQTIYLRVPYLLDKPIATATPTDLITHGKYSLQILKIYGERIHRWDFASHTAQDITDQIPDARVAVNPSVSGGAAHVEVAAAPVTKFEVLVSPVMDPDLRNWTSLGIVDSADGRVGFDDQAAAGANQRFYGLRPAPAAVAGLRIIETKPK